MDKENFIYITLIILLFKMKQLDWFLNFNHFIKFLNSHFTTNIFHGMIEIKYAT